jgi:hypothetical protein
MLYADDMLSMVDTCDMAGIAANLQPMSDCGFSSQPLVYSVAAQWRFCVL